jgi:subtilisin family serine protease
MKRMKTRTLCLLIALSVSTYCMAQHRLSTALKQELAHTSDNDLLRVQLVVADKADLSALQQRFSSERLSTAQRAQLVAQHLRLHTEAAQQPILEAIEAFRRQHPEQVGRVDRLWVTNLITVDASRALILQLAEMDAIRVIDLDGRWRIRMMEPIRGEEQQNRSVGGIEPGLAAIGARFMWNLGYTGRNRIAYTLDTGIWPEHPAIRDRFLYHRYPIQRTWFAYDSPLPADKTSSHGTHCTGTMVGLDPSTADTIGMAFNAYFIASDPVVSNLAFLKPLTDFLHAFEWAIDPDGDPLTLNDVPDVINNSWGFDPPADTLVCESVVADMLNAVEAAGIANVFAAGNDGPNPMTIGTPNYINTGLVNTFTVGALNGNTPTFPITNFSSQGPSPCGGGGSLAIKPEVSAPGLNVRSCVGQNGYDVYSGTSMASPHVAGAVLLLKEAFPMATGEEILLALYNSAIDLGDLGEDNTYGMGIVNLEAAFNLLSQILTPVPPMAADFDLEANVTSPIGGLACESSISPIIRLHNRGQETIQSVNITYGQVGQNLQGHTWTGTLTSGSEVDVPLPTLNISGEDLIEVWFNAQMSSPTEELDVHNNHAMLRFYRRVAEALPFNENFENMTFADGRWLVENPDGAVTWDTVSIAGPHWSSVSAYFSFYTYSPRLDQKDAITSPLLQIGLEAVPTALRFDRFYTFFHQNFADSMRILVSSDCGASWATVFNKGGATLASHSASGGNRWPQSVDEWVTEHVNLSSYAGQQILLRFETTNRKGNHFLLDNIWVYSGAEPSGVTSADEEKVFLYPNPSNGLFHFSGWSAATEGTATVTDVQGRTVIRTNLSSPYLDLSAFPDGLYHIRLQHDGADHVFRAVKVAGN